MTTATIIQPTSGAHQLVVSQAQPTLGMEYDSDSALWVPSGSRQRYSSGVAHITSRDGAGVPFWVAMSPKVNGSSNFGSAAECITDATGFSRVTCTIEGVTSNQGAGLVVAYSLSYNDQTAVQANATSAATKYGTQDGTLLQFVTVIPIVPGFERNLDFDTTQLCKTVGFMLTGAVVGLSFNVDLVKP